MDNFFRKQEYLALMYRLFLAYVFYFIARLLFLIYNFDLLNVDSIGEFFRLSYYGLAFDTTAILYVNGLFVLFSILPLWINTSVKYQRFLFYIYFLFNLIAYAINFVDFIYYKYTFSRTTIVVWNVLENETNKANMFFRFLFSYWHVYLLFFIISTLWIIAYRKVKVKQNIFPKNKIKYFSSSVIAIVVIGTLIVGGIRGGDFKKSTRPINMVDASRHVKKIEHSDLVLNTPFAFIRTIRSNDFKKLNYNLKPEAIDKYLKPVKQYSKNPKSKPNVVLIITESLSREYIGSFNKNMNIENYKGYTPFLDSLAQHSLIFPNAFANGTKSIHGMSSILAGIPSFKSAFTSSPYSKQKIQSLVSVLNGIDYDTSFFHGSSNGSMGFLGFGNILGFDHYYGENEYNNNEDFDGAWGIWDEPFMHYMKETLDQKEEPFFSTLFTITSHEPYVIPDKYEGKFPKGSIPMHECVGYTDYAFKEFFKEAQKAPWFENTIFIITADHCNEVYYGDEYSKNLNRNAVPILIYTPDGSLKGENFDLAQQIDIYPTVLDMIGYDKPFRSWGRSLVGDDNIVPFAINYGGLKYRMQRGNYICIFDDEKTTGFYDINDKGLENNLINQRNEEMNQAEIACKAFLQEYYAKIMDKKLTIE
ncbi:MAG: phosphoglycerol transferase MdoB-like AlkP superfamily enzyme [Ulvibacter sp.]|jgi:phosphoglycerol transferase MdoB-like AlkP superfamily enzyme